MTEMESGERFDKVLALGEKIVDELELEDSSDTLGRWMAHYLAELIEDSRTSRGAESSAKKKDCADLIVKLWDHRSGFPDGKRPMDEFQTVLEVMQSLKSSDDYPRYWPSGFRNSARVENLRKPEMLRAALGIDSAAKALIRYCLADAAGDLLKGTREWIDAVESADLLADIDLEAVQAVLEDSDNLLNDHSEEHRKEIAKLLKQLDQFEKMSSVLRTNLIAEQEASGKGSVTHPED
jgi:hypothetical protein